MLASLKATRLTHVDSHTHMQTHVHAHTHMHDTQNKLSTSGTRQGPQTDTGHGGKICYFIPPLVQPEKLHSSVEATPEATQLSYKSSFIACRYIQGRDISVFRPLVETGVKRSDFNFSVWPLTFPPNSCFGLHLFAWERKGERESVDMEAHICKEHRHFIFSANRWFWLFIWYLDGKCPWFSSRILCKHSQFYL